MSNHQLAEDIQAVHDYIERNGWNQGDYYGGDGDPEGDNPACLLGANRASLRRAERHVERRVALENFLEDQLITNNLVPVDKIEEGHGTRLIAEKRLKIAEHPNNPFALEYSFNYSAPIPYFNDRVAKDKADVLSFLDKARIAAEEKA